MTYYIYALLDPKGRNIAYVGKTTDLKRRFRQHIADTGRDAKKSVTKGQNHV